MKVTFLLMGYKGLTVLRTITKSSYSELIRSVIIGKDKNVQNDYSIEIEKLCKSKNINCNFSSNKVNPDTDYIIAVSWRNLIPSNEHKKVIVFHDSLLPKYRGFAPLVNSLINGEKEIGVTAFYATSEYDEGDIILRAKQEIDYPIKIQEAIERISTLYSELIIKILAQIKNKYQLPKGKPQDHKLASYSLWRNNEDYYIDWNLSSEYLKRFIDAVGFPYDGAKCYLDQQLVCIKEATTVPDLQIEIRQPGKAIFIKNGEPVIVCGEGLLRIKEAYYIETGKSILPLNKFRKRFQ